MVMVILMVMVIVLTMMMMMTMMVIMMTVLFSTPELTSADPKRRQADEAHAARQQADEAHAAANLDFVPHWHTLPQKTPEKPDFNSCEL